MLIILIGLCWVLRGKSKDSFLDSIEVEVEVEEPYKSRKGCNDDKVPRRGAGAIIRRTALELFTAKIWSKKIVRSRSLFVPRFLTCVRSTKIYSKVTRCANKVTPYVNKVTRCAKCTKLLGTARGPKVTADTSADP